MWCRTCGQDVPGVPSIEEGKYSCARCGKPVGPVSQHQTAAAESASLPKDDPAKTVTASAASQRPPIYDGWEIEEQLRHIRRVLGSAEAPKKGSGASADHPKFRVDGGHNVPTPQLKRARQGSKKKERPAAPTNKHNSGGRLLAGLAWMMLWLGSTGSICGLSLMGWSMHTGRQDLWAVGVPIILAGQVALILGLVLELDRIWHDNRRAVARLETVDEQLHDLKTTTSLLGTTHGPSSAFYAHWAGGAGPEILLSDLKSQMDLLAVKLSQE